MAARYRGCKLCKPHKAMGNSKKALTRRLRRYLDSGKAR